MTMAAGGRTDVMLGGCRTLSVLAGMMMRMLMVPCLQLRQQRMRSGRIGMGVEKCRGKGAGAMVAQAKRENGGVSMYVCRRVWISQGSCEKLRSRPVGRARTGRRCGERGEEARLGKGHMGGRVAWPRPGPIRDASLVLF
jgi:hypothetical protein